MKEFFQRPWTKRAMSLLSVPYGLFIAYLAYISVFYTVVVDQKVTFGIVFSLICLAFGTVMVYTRKQVVTMIVCMAHMPFLLPVFLLNLGEWELLIPMVLVSVAMFFLCGANESVKTILATIFLVIYIMGALAYFLMTSMFVSSIQKSVHETGVSLSGDYRYEVIYTKDKSEGSTFVTVEPNTNDLDYKLFRCIERGMEKTVYLQRPLGEVKIEWKQETREEITAYLLAVNPDVKFTLTLDQLRTVKMEDTYTEAIRVKNLSKAQRAMLDIHLESDYKTVPEGVTLYTDSTITLNVKQMQEIGWTIAASVPLSQLTDVQLADLGVPTSGDVMYINDKPVFRYYVAIIENCFDPANREIELK